MDRYIYVVVKKNRIMFSVHVVTKVTAPIGTTIPDIDVLRSPHRNRLQAQNTSSLSFLILPEVSGMIKCGISNTLFGMCMIGIDVIFTDVSIFVMQTDENRVNI